MLCLVKAVALSLLAGAALADLDLRRPRHLTDCLRGDVGNQSRSSLDHLLLSLGAKQRETPGQSSRSSWCAMPSFFRFVLQHCTSCSELLIIMPRHCSLDAYMAPFALPHAVSLSISICNCSPHRLVLLPHFPLGFGTSPASQSAALCFQGIVL